MKGYSGAWPLQTFGLWPKEILSIRSGYSANSCEGLFRGLRLPPAQGYSGAVGPFSLLACGQKKYPHCARVIQLAPAVGPFSLLVCGQKKYPRCARVIQLAPAFGPFSLLAFGQKKYPRSTRVIKLAPAEGYSGAFGPFNLLACGQNKYFADKMCLFVRDVELIYLWSLWCTLCS